MYLLVLQDYNHSWPFYRQYIPQAVGYHPTFDSIDGGVLVGGRPKFVVNGESNLDFQYGIGLTHPTPTTLYQVGGG